MKTNFNPDRLDKVAFTAIIALCVLTAVLWVYYRGGPSVSSASPGPRETTAKKNRPADADARIKEITNLINGGGNPSKAQALINEALARYPYEGEFHMLMGDVYMRMMEPVRAVSQYKKAVDLNPDFADKTSRSFEGGKIRVAIREAKPKILAALDKDPADARMKGARSDLYYLLRRLAGSCG